jgi:hypothetical protein
MSKIDIVNKMPYKRKVLTEEVENIATALGGLAF